MKRAIAIFVKTPGLSPIKPELANNIGEANALEFYKHAVACTAAMCNEMQEVTPFWAVAEKEGLEHWPAFETLWTGGGNTGKQQHTIYSKLIRQFSEVMLINIDCPQLSSHDIHSGLDLLPRCDFVMGTASDGGYTFLAGNKEIPANVWESVSFNQPDTHAKLRHVLKGVCKEIGPHTSVKTLPDLTAMLFEMPREKTEAQSQLCDWTRKLLTG